MRAVAGIQGFFQANYAELVDRNPQFLSNLKGERFKIKLDLDQLAGLRRHGLTVGTFVAHFLQPNNWNDLVETTGTIIHDDFKQLLSDRIQNLDEAKKLPEGAYWQRFETDLRNLFEVRHIICHEAAPPQRLDGNRCFEMLISASNLLSTSQAIFEEKLHRGNHIRTGRASR